MIRLKTVTSVLAAAGAFLAFGDVRAASDPALIEAAKAEGSVTWASGLVINQAARPVANAFTKKYGINVDVMVAENLLLRMTNEARAGKATIDVFDDGGSAMAAIRKADLVAPYTSPEAAAFSADHRDPEGYWTAYCLFFYTVVVNTDLVPPEEEPQTFADLLDPKWKGRMVWQNSENAAGPPSFVGARLTSMGQADGMAYLEKLAGQDVVRVTGNARSALDQVILGEYPMALMSLNHHVVISAEQGAPVKWLKLSPLIGTMETTAVAKNAPHPNAAKLFYDFLLSEEGQNVLKAANYLPARPGVPARVAELKPDAGGFTAVTIQPAMAKEGLPGWVEIYKRLFVH